MKRRTVLQIPAALLVAPLARAQSGPVRRVAIIFTTTPLADLAGPEPVHPFARAFLRAMRERGYAEGRNFILERRSAEGHWDRTTEIVADLVRLQADVIVIANTELALRAVKVARDVPLVVVAGDNLVRAGLAHSLARPGGNVTGTTTDVDEGTELKRLDLFLALLSKAPRIAFVGTKHDWSNAHGSAMRAAATTRGAKVFHIESSDESGYEAAFSKVRAERPDAFWIARSATALAHRAAIGQFSRESGVPGACGHAEAVALGCLMSYGFLVSDLVVQAASYVDRILKGARPADLPIEQPRKFEFVLNLGTARQIGLAIPQSVLVRADRVIE